MINNSLINLLLDSSQSYFWFQVNQTSFFYFGEKNRKLSNTKCPAVLLYQCSLHNFTLRVPNYTQTIVQKYKCPVMATVLFCLKQTQDMSRFLKIITALQIPEYPLRFFKRIQQALYQIDYHKENRSSPGSSPESRPRSSSL